MERTAVWEGIDEPRVETAHVWLEPPVWARGTQIGDGYRADYELDARPDCVTRSLVVETKGRGWERRLELRHDGAGSWTADTRERGDPGLPPPGGDMDFVAGALDCDLALSPLTNLLPILRHGLHADPGRRDFLMAWVSLPDLGVHASRQSYETVRIGDRPVVRYSDPELSAELELDGDGLVVLYPELARRAEVRS